MLEQIDPMDPTGLTFDSENIRPEPRTRKFTVSGFRNKDHAQAWADAYYKRAWGYGPSISLNETADGIKVFVNEMTSCD